MFTRIFNHYLASIDCCPWVGHACAVELAGSDKPKKIARFLYSPAERRRRDATPWTMVQGILAPIQFAVFLASLGLVLNYLISILAKTVLLVSIMVTGAIWEHEVFGQYLFARSFFWEDVFSFLVIGLHLCYVFALCTHLASPRTQMLLALAAYASYVINASQFLMKLRAARLEQLSSPVGFAG
jgi:3-vinyl bacteriochlorophyllide hydratase